MTKAEIIESIQREILDQQRILSDLAIMTQTESVRKATDDANDRIRQLTAQLNNLRASN